MSVKYINAEELCRMNGQEGLVLQGCGGDSQEWLDGINELLTEDGIILTEQSLKMLWFLRMESLLIYVFPLTAMQKLI